MSNPSKSTLFPEMSGTPAISDAMDDLGLAPGMIEGLRLLGAIPDQPLAGRARVGTVVPVSEKGMGSLSEFIDGAQSGDVLVLEWRAAATCSTFGGNAAARAAKVGVLALVVDGWVRDVPEWEECGMTAFCRDSVPLTGNGRVGISMTEDSVRLRGVTIRSGDIVVADRTGVCVIPDSEHSRVINRAAGLERFDDAFRGALSEGSTFAETIANLAAMRAAI